MIGAVFNSRYELAGTLADGPIFTSFSARDRQNGREVCIRLMKAPFDQERQFVDRLRSTVRKHAAVVSSNIEALHDVLEDGGHVYILSDLTRGPSLADRIRKLAPFSVAVSLSAAISICKALDALHRADLCHGDLSSGNVAILADGEARLQLPGIWEAYGGSPTAGSLVLPSMAPYLAPEVSAGSMPSPQSDVYSVGILLYELLAGRPPYHGDSALATAMKHRTQETPTVRAINPSVPEVLDQVVRKAMDKEPSERYANAGQMLADLRVLQDALRFGKSLTWPLTGGPGKAKSADPEPVTPTMSARRTKEQALDEPKRARHERDVPVWMIVVMTALGAAVLSLLGIWVLFNLQKPRLVEVPNIRGLTLEEARAMVGAYDLEVQIERRVSSEKIAADHIIDVRPEPGQKVREGGKILATVSFGSRYVDMPDLREQTKDKARATLETLGLEVEQPMQFESHRTIPMDSVVRQSPEPGVQTERSSRVRLWVSSGPDGGGTDGPAQRFLYTVRVAIANVPEPVNVRIDLIDKDSPDGRTIYTGTHEDGEEVVANGESVAPSATFKIYYDDLEVKTVQKSAEGAVRP